MAAKAAWPDSIAGATNLPALFCYSAILSFDGLSLA
jgi:hypothetical protein